jgi:hypothetical protein
MLLRTIPSIAFLSLAVFCSASVKAQTVPPPVPADPSSSPASQSSASNDKPTPSSPSPATSTTKKVWTEEEMAGLHGKGADSISQPGNAPANPYAPSTRPKGTSSNRDAKWYHDQIQNLQAKLPPIEKNIAMLQAAISGKPTGDAVTSTRPSGVKTDDWGVQLAQAQKERDDILAKISALRDEARHKGVPPNALP